MAEEADEGADIRRLQRRIARLERRLRQHEPTPEKAQLEDARSLIRALLEASTDGILVEDRYGGMVDYNARLLTLWRVPPEAVRPGADLHQSSLLLQQLRDSEDYLHRTARLRDDPEAEDLDVLELKDGRVLERYCVPRRMDGEVVGRVWSFRDITAIRRFDERLHYLANYDELTGLPNRSLFRDRLKQAIARARRGSAQIAVLFMDLDRFKSVNDTLGHAMGDELLCGVAERIRQCLREEDTVARQGGDEFSVVLEGIGSGRSAAAVAEKILRRFAAPFRLGGHEVYTSASIGITLYPSDAADAEALLKNADTAMYLAKDRGRGTYRFFTPELDMAARQRLLLEAGLRKAVDRGELRLRYQPQVDLRSGALIGFEALLRWQHPELGLLTPDRFIPVAEETGAIIPMGEWVLAQVCAQWRQWRDLGLPPMTMAVNMSVRQFRQPELAANIEGLLREAGMEAHWLELELTESMLMTNADISTGILEGLKAVGIRLAVDDFGTGYSSLTYLKRFPLDTLKIDRAFIRDIADACDDAEIARGVVALARALHLTVVAEGVESQAQRDFLLREGCYFAQGFMYGRPMPPEQATAMLRAGVCPPGQ